ncbi:nuclear envelope pore membrane protein POM 121 [Menidia menidia]
MQVLRRRVAAMSPREKHLALLSVLGLFTLAFYFIPTFLYATLILAGCCSACYYRWGEPLPARLGPNPRGGLNVPGVLRRWLWDWGATGESVIARKKTRSSGSNRAELRETEGHFGQRPRETGIYRRETLSSDSFLYSPRDFLMGSYIGKPESPPVIPGRPRAGRNPREQLRERLCRPNNAVYTPNRRLSFTGEPLVPKGRFTITPQRHYPLQQPGVSSVGFLPPVRWDGFRKKNILSPRNSPAAHSPVTVKIARPDHSSPSMDHLTCAGLSRAPEDPCSRESVLKVLKESRKRDVDDEDRTFITGQKSKRRRNDSGGSAHSAFESLLPNGTPSQLVPKPGTLKRGMTSVADEQILKRSRTSSISSGSALHSPRGTPGTRRNAIQSSYSSSLGIGQWKKPSAPSSPLSSPGSSRSQTPEGAAKRAREDDAQSPSSASSVRSDHIASDRAPVASKLTPVPKVPVTSSADSAGSGGKRKRKIQLVSSHRDDQISLPPPPELGYTVTAKDLDEEKKAAISKIQKVLETPAPEPEKSVSPPASTSTQPTLSVSSAGATTLSSLLAAPLPTPSSSTIPVINLDPSPASRASAAPPASNPLLEALKMKITTTPSDSTSAATTVTVSASTTPVQAGSLNLKLSAPAQPPPPYPAQPSSSVGQPSAFTQVLAQVSKAPSSTAAAPVTGPTLFGMSTQAAAPSVTSAPPAAAASANPLLAAGFKPIFPATTTTTSSPSAPSSESRPAVQNFKPIFGDPPSAAAVLQPSSIATAATLPATTAPSFSTTSTSNAAVVPNAFSGFNSTPATGSTPSTQPAAQPSLKSLFGSWSTPPTKSSSSASVQPPSTGSTFQFGAATTTAAPAPSTAAPTTTSSTQGTFAFGAAQPSLPAANPTPFGFGQKAPTQNAAATTAAFGGFALPSTASTAAATSTQSTFTFGKSAFEAPATQSTFGSSTAAPKPFAFGGSGAPSTPASTPAPAPAPAPAPFTFGAAAVTAATTFGTPAKPTFGSGSAGFAFGASPAPPAAPSFGAAQTQTQSSASTTTFTFGGAAPQPAPPAPTQPAPAGFNFGASMPCPQFGTPVSSNPAPQMGSFNFGPTATDKPAFGTSTPSFGQSAAAGPIPFGSPGTPVQGFSAVPFGSPATPSFSIGAGSKPSGARQRLQARRQHNRKK